MKKQNKTGNPLEFLGDAKFPKVRNSNRVEGERAMAKALKKVKKAKANKKITWGKAKEAKASFAKHKGYFSPKERALFEACVDGKRGKKCTELLRKAQPVLAQIDRRAKTKKNATIALSRWDKKTKDKIVVIDRKGKITKNAGYVFRKVGNKWVTVKQRVKIGTKERNFDFSSPIKLSSVDPRFLSPRNRIEVEKRLKTLTGPVDTKVYKGDTSFENLAVPIYMQLRENSLSYQKVLVEVSYQINGRQFNIEFFGFANSRQRPSEVMKWFFKTSHQKLCEQLESLEWVTSGSVRAILDYNGADEVDADEPLDRFSDDLPWAKSDYKQVQIEQMTVAVMGVDTK